MDIKKILLVVLIIGIYLWPRFYELESKMTFHLDQGLQLLETKEMVDGGKIRLIGPMVSSKTFLDRGFFIGPQYYYILAILGIGENWDPLLITQTLVIIDLIIFGIFCWWIGKKWNFWTASIVGFVIAISPYLILHSRFVWNPHMMLWMTMMAVIALDKKWYLLLGTMWGVAFGFHYSAILWIFPMAFYFAKYKTWKWIWLPIGFVIGDLPYLIFELRHGFYNLKTFYWVMTQANNSTQLEAHYLINPLLSFAIVAIICGLYKIKNIAIRLLITMVLIVITYGGQYLIYANERMPLGHPIGWTYLTEKEVVKNILINGCPKDFNIASTISGDTRTYDIRFLLTAKNCQPMGVDKYPEAKTLYLIAPPTRPPEKETVWEVTSLGKFKINQSVIINNNVVFYELEKI